MSPLTSDRDRIRIDGAAHMSDDQSAPAVPGYGQMAVMADKDGGRSGVRSGRERIQKLAQRR